MASFLDIGLLNVFSVIFTFLLLYAVFWGIMIKLELFGKSPGLYAVIALAGAFLVTLTAPARAYVEFVTPWFLVMGLVFFFIVITVSMFTEVPWDKVLDYSTTQTWIIIFIAIIMASGAFSLFGQSSLEATTGPQPVMNEDGEIVNAGSFASTGQGGTATGNIETNVANTIVHPKVLGIILIFGLSALIVYFLSRPVGGL